MKAAGIEYAKGAFHVEITEDGRVVALRSVTTYREAITATADAGITRGNVTLTPAAQAAAAQAFFGRTA